MSARAGVTAVAALLAAGCAVHSVVTTDADGLHHLSCPSPLSACLSEAENVCEHKAYAVLLAFDDHDLRGDPVFPVDTRRSEATIRCASRVSWGAEKTKLEDARRLAQRAAEDVPVPAAPPAAAPGCTPGVSQACIGPAGCKGGQSCTPDGKSFGPCDCGPPAASPP